MQQMMQMFQYFMMSGIQSQLPQQQQSQIPNNNNNVPIPNQLMVSQSGPTTPINSQQHHQNNIINNKSLIATTPSQLVGIPSKLTQSQSVANAEPYDDEKENSKINKSHTKQQKKVRIIDDNGGKIIHHRTKSGRPIPAPPPKDVTRSRSATPNSPKPPPPPIPRNGTISRNGGRDGSRKHDHKHGRHNKHHKHRDHGKSSKKNKDFKRAKSQTRDGEHKKKKHHKRKKQKSVGVDVEALDFVPINPKFGKSSPTISQSNGILNNLDELVLDEDTPSDEESLLWVQEDVLAKNDADNDVEVSYDWNARKPKKKYYRKLKKFTCFFFD